MHFSSSILLVVATAPLAIAKPVPHFRLPFRRSTGDVRPWDGAIERDWNGTLDLPSAEIPKKSTVETPPIVLHKTLDEAHPYFAFLRKLVKRDSHHVGSLRTTDGIADTPEMQETAKVPVPIPLATPPPGAQLPPPKAGTPPPPPPTSMLKLDAEAFDAEVDTNKRAAPAPTPAPKSDDEKRQVQYLPPSWPTGLGIAGAPPTPDIIESAEEFDEDDDDFTRNQGPEASQLPPGHPKPENSALPQDWEVGSFPLIGNVKRDMMTLEDLERRIKVLNLETPKDAEEAKKLAGKIDRLEQRQKGRELKRGTTVSAEQLRQAVRSKTIDTAEDAREVKKLVGEIDLAEKSEKHVQLTEEAAQEELRLTKRNNKFAGSDIVTPEEASQAWKLTTKSAKGGEAGIKGMETWVHENPFGKSDEEDERMERRFGLGDEHEVPGGGTVETRLRFGKRDVAKPHLESQSQSHQGGNVVVEAPVVEVVVPNAQLVQSVEGGEATHELATEQVVEAPDVAVKSADNKNPKKEFAAAGSGGYGPGGYGGYGPGGYGGYGPGGYGPGGYGPAEYNGGGYNGGGFNGGGYNGGGYNGGGGGRGGYGGYGGRGGYRKGKV